MYLCLLSIRSVPSIYPLLNAPLGIPLWLKIPRRQFSSDHRYDTSTHRIDVYPSGFTTTQKEYKNQATHVD